MTIKDLTLVEDEAHAAATSHTGITDFGDPSYLQGLRQLLRAYEEDVVLTANGRQAIFDGFVGILRARLYTQRGWSRHPEALETSIPRSIVITGLPRSGTTALHKILSIDARFQGLELWLVGNPMPRPPREQWSTFPERQMCSDKFQAIHDRVPALNTAHVFSVDEVEECTSVLMQNFVSRAWVETLNLPTYDHWFSSQSTRDSYRRYADVLRLVGANAPNKPWLLKSPHHLAETANILEVMPDAYIVQTHRDPLATIPSLCNLMRMITEGVQMDLERTALIGTAQCLRWRDALELADRVRQQSPERFIDVDYRDLTTDPISVVADIYERSGFELQSADKDRMAAWAHANPAGKHGKHSFDASDLGFSADELAQIYKDYRERHHFTE